MGVTRTLSARYRIEPDFRIGWTSANWDRFARENDADELTGGAVVGRPLLDFIDGAETRAIYDSLLKRVQGTGTEIDLAFRCDSPEKRRFMTLHMSCPDDGQVMLSAELLREEPRPRVGLLDPELPRDGEPVEICSFCKRVETRPDVWREVEEAGVELGIVDDAPLPPLRNRVCPDCKAVAQRA